MTLAQHGAYGETGVWRPIYSPDWVAAQEMVASWCRDIGMDVRQDAVGSVWGKFAGSEGGKSIVSGSHIDSQCPGGRYDGALGVIAAYIAMRTLAEQFGPPRRTLELVSLCEEEGSRYPAANYWGSRAITGRIAPEDPEQLSVSMERPSPKACGRLGSIRPVSTRPGVMISITSSSCTSSRDRSWNKPVCRSASSPGSPAPRILGHAHWSVRPCRSSTDGSAARPDGRRRRDHLRRHQHRAPHGPPGGDDRRADRGRPEPLAGRS